MTSSNQNMLIETFNTVSEGYDDRAPASFLKARRI
jgi:hypothetical protein